MANTRNTNTFYIDTQYSVATDELKIPNLKVPYIIVTASTAPGTLVLTDSAGATKIKIATATANETKIVDLRRNPIVFPTGIRATTLTNCVATLIIDESRS